jgi:two-component system response regulator PilR (NtrC family)
MIDVDTLPVPLRQPADRQDVSLELPPEGLDLEATLDRIEQRYMQMALDRMGGVQTRAAELLRVSFRQFRYKLQKFQQREPPREG